MVASRHEGLLTSGGRRGRSIDASGHEGLLTSGGRRGLSLALFVILVSFRTLSAEKCNDIAETFCVNRIWFRCRRW
eukprot:COSAG02_NODE_2902_length_7777_cov_3.802292_10_plen_76_part_00